MTDHDSGSPPRGGSPPGADGRRIVAEFETFQDLLDRCAGRLSEDGVCLEAPSPPAAGSQISFQLRIRDGFTVLQGEGQVVSSEEPTAPPAGAETVVIRFEYLDQPSLRLLPRLIDHYRRHGVSLLDFDRLLPEEQRLPDITLDDLEAEFLSPLPAPVSEPDEPASPVPGDRLDAEGPALVDAADLSTAAESWELSPTPDLEPTSEDDEIRLQELMDGAPPEVSSGAGIEDAVDAELVEDSTPDPELAWLFEEPARDRKRELWVIVGLIVLGALLGVAFYFLVIRDAEPQSQQPTPEPTPVSRITEPPPGRELDAGAAQEMLEVLPPQESPESQPRPPAVEGEAGEEAPAPASAVARKPPLTGIDRITFEEQEDETVVTLWADGTIRAEQIDDFRIGDGTPREVVRIRGISRPCPEQRVDLDSDRIQRIRTGLHRNEGVGELHVVADLVDGDVKLLRTEARGSQVRLHFARAG